jgi:hypothetical protein
VVARVRTGGRKWSTKKSNSRHSPEDNHEQDDDAGFDV